MSDISHLQPGTVEGTKPSELWRIGRAANPLHFSTISVTDADLPKAGNRFDVAGGGVLYAATDLKGCYLETLARFRPSARVREAVQEQDGHFMICGGVPADWRSQRVKAILALSSPLPFLDVEAPETHEYLTTAMAPELASLGIGVLDVAAARGPDRRVTRAISRWAYAAVDEAGNPRFSGIRYVSRLADHECWAIFEGTVVTERARFTIPLDDDEMKTVAELYGLRIF